MPDNTHSESGVLPDDRLPHQPTSDKLAAIFEQIEVAGGNLDGVTSDVIGAAKDAAEGADEEGLLYGLEPRLAAATCLWLGVHKSNVNVKQKHITAELDVEAYQISKLRSRMVNAGLITRQEGHSHLVAGDAPWTTKDVLEKYLDAGYTFRDIADGFEHATEFKIHYWADKYGLSSPHDAPTYEGDDVPVIREVNTVKFPLPVDLIKEFNLSSGQYARTMVGHDQGELYFELDVGDSVTGVNVNEKLLSRPTDSLRHLYYAFPQRIVAATDYLQAIPEDTTLRELRQRGPIPDPDEISHLTDFDRSFDDDNNEASRIPTGLMISRDSCGTTIRFTPYPGHYVWNAVSGRQLTTAQADLTPIRAPTHDEDKGPLSVSDLRRDVAIDYYGSIDAYETATQAGETVMPSDLGRRLIPLWANSVTGSNPADRTINNLSALRLYIPSDWRAAYGIGTGTDDNDGYITARQRVGLIPTTEDTRLGLIIDFKANVSDLRRHDITYVYEEEKRVYDDKGDSTGTLQGKAYMLYPHRAVLNALGIGLTDPKPAVDLVPGPDWIGIVPPAGVTSDLNYRL